MTGQPDETRSEDEIRAEVAELRAIPQRERTGMARTYLDHVEYLLADRSRLAEEAGKVEAELDRWRAAKLTMLREHEAERNALRTELAAARAEVTRLGRDLDEAEGLLRDWLAWGKAIADALGLNYDTDQERDERMIADAMRMRAAIDEAVRMCNGPGSAQSEASQVKKRVGGVLAAALGGVPEDERRSE